MANKQTVFVAVHENRHGIIIRVFDSFSKVQAWKDAIGKENWERVSDDPQPEDACGDDYFDLSVERGEYFTWEECEVQ